MSTLKAIIQQHRLKTNPTPADLLDFISKVAKDIITQRFSEFETEMKEELEEIRDETETQIGEAVKEITEKTFKGDKGDKGERGDRGDSITGPQGIQGPAGKDGKQGLKGEKGLSGKDGQNGKDGINGKDGSSDQPKDVAKKLNTLTEVIEQSVIKGLEKRFADILRVAKEKAIQKGGGGMGNVQHETFNVSSATTTITTAYPIGGKGYSIFTFEYQGQGLFRGTGYTVGSDKRTLTLQFMPEDSMIITVVYIRG